MDNIGMVFEKFVRKCNLYTNLDFADRKDTSLIFAVEGKDIAYSFKDGMLKMNGTTIIRDVKGTLIFGILPEGDMLFQVAPEMPVMIYSLTSNNIESIVHINENKLFYIKCGKLICIETTNK